jgi:hypothetical protein
MRVPVTGDAATIARVTTLLVTKATVAAILSGGPVPGVPVKASHRWDVLDMTVVSEETLGPRGEDIAHTSLMIAVDAGGQAMDAKVRWQVVIVVGFAVGIDVGLQRDDCIGKLRGLDRMQKDVSTSAIAIVKIHLSLEAEVKEISACAKLKMSSEFDHCGTCRGTMGSKPGTFNSSTRQRKSYPFPDSDQTEAKAA